jgi:hypothetical protein
MPRALVPVPATSVTSLTSPPAAGGRAMSTAFTRRLRPVACLPCREGLQVIAECS